MKNLILTIISSLVVVFSSGQTLQNCEKADLAVESNIKAAESCVLIAADYVLSHPLYGNDKIYSEYRGFILSWMEKTPDYEFSLNKKVMAICGEEDNLMLFGVYTTCLAKSAVHLKTDFAIDALKTLAQFMKNPENKVKQTSKVKKFIADSEANNLDKYVK